MGPLRLMQLLTIAWLASEALIFLRDRQPGAEARRDLGSRLGLFAAIGIGFFVANQAVAQQWLPLPGPRAGWMIAGTLLVVGGILYRQYAVRRLGAYFRTQVTMLDDHRLITDGPYARLRHPTYSGALLTCAGIGVVAGSGVALAAMVGLPLAAFAYRIGVEERALAEHFGADWAAYRARTAALIPGLW